MDELNLPIAIDWYLSPEFPHREGFADKAQALIDAYEAAGRGLINFRRIEVKTDEDRKEASSFGLPAIPVPEGGPEKGSFSGLVFSQGDQRTVLPHFAGEPVQTLETLATLRLRELLVRTRRHVFRIGVVAGKGGITMHDPLLPKCGSATIESIFGENFAYYRTEPVDLNGGNDAVDQGLAGLVVTQPAADYSDAELRRIDEFVLRGGKALAVVVSALSLGRDESGRTAALTLHGLTPLLRGYGFDLGRDLVVDASRHFSPAGHQGTNGYPAIVRVSGAETGVTGPTGLDIASLAFLRMDYAMFPYPSSIALVPTQQPDDVRFAELARTERSASALVDLPPSLRDVSGPSLASRPGPFIVAASVEGRLKSALSTARAPTPSKVMLVASSHFTSNPFVSVDTLGCEGSGVADSLGKAKAVESEAAELATIYAREQLVTAILAVKNVFDWMTIDAPF